MIPTAKELFDKMIEENDECTSTEMMIEFAELHVRQTLLEAIREAPYHCEKGVLNCYPLENIK